MPGQLAVGALAGLGAGRHQAAVKDLSLDLLVVGGEPDIILPVALLAGQGLKLYGGDVVATGGRDKPARRGWRTDRNRKMK